MQQVTVKYKVLDPRAHVPAYATAGAAAADLCAVLDAPLTLAPMERALVPTGLAIELPGPETVALVYAPQRPVHQARPVHGQRRGCGGQRLPRGAACPMINLGAEAYTIQPGERVAQLCIAPVYTAAFVPAETPGGYRPGRGGLWLHRQVRGQEG